MNARIPQPLIVYADEAARLADQADKIFLQQAREEIVSTVMLFGQYPQPRKSRSAAHDRPCRFALYEFLFDTANKTYIDPVEVEEFFVLAMIDGSSYGAFSDKRNKFEKQVAEILEAHFNDEHPLVREVADQMEADAREEA